MRIRRAVVLVALTAAAGGSLTGCGNGADTASPSASSPAPASPTPSPTADPTAELAASVRALTTTTYQVTTKTTGDDAATGTATVEPVAKNASVAQAGVVEGNPIKIELLLIGNDRYARFTGIPGVNGDTWAHMDATKVASIPDLGVDKLTDPAGAGQFAKAIVTAEKSGPGQYSGTFDLTRAVDMVDQSSADVAAIGAPAKSLPFKATLDEQGRLGTLAFTVPAHGQSKAADYVTTFSGYGSPANLAKPPANTIKEAPAAMYQLFQG
ncbi:MAG TPA: hypothetical protein VK453_23105 [Micromonosporaceae bacterium]|nr:hypothetical protein [Micromonosporaceae bacterium]